jgi:hypothetical protein
MPLLATTGTYKGACRWYTQFEKYKVAVSEMEDDQFLEVMSLHPGKLNNRRLMDNDSRDMASDRSSPWSYELDPNLCVPVSMVACVRTAIDLSISKGFRRQLVTITRFQAMLSRAAS